MTSRIRAEVVPYSSVVGGGVVLMDETGKVIGQLALLNFGVGIADDAAFKTAYVALTERIARAINAGQSEREIRHLKKGTEYDVLGAAVAQVSVPAPVWDVAEVQRTRPMTDGATVVVYARRDDGEPRLFVRFPDEINDTNRFEEITP